MIIAMTMMMIKITNNFEFRLVRRFSKAISSDALSGFDKDPTNTKESLEATMFLVKTGTTFCNIIFIIIIIIIIIFIM
jgi:hypothetical protein